MGQTLDLLSTQFGTEPVLEKFTMDRYSSIVKYKTAYYSFHLPVALAMYMVCIILMFFVVIYHYFIFTGVHLMNIFFFIAKNVILSHACISFVSMLMNVLVFMLLSILINSNLILLRIPL
jgi:hypothetical protein